MDDVTRAALAWEDATGTAIENTVAEFEKIRKDPVNALLDLNESYHFLTQPQLDHIKRLQDEGKESQAAAEATKLYAGVLEDRSQQMIGSLGVLESQWRGLKGAATEAWDSMLAVGRDGSIAGRIAQAALLAQQMNYGGAYAHLSGQVRDASVSSMVENAMKANDQLLSGVDSERAKRQIKEDERKAEAQKKFYEDGLKYGSDREQLEQRILAMISQGQADGISADKLRTREAQMRAEFAEKEAKAAERAANKRKKLTPEEKAWQEWEKDQAALDEVRRKVAADVFQQHQKNAEAIEEGRRATQDLIADMEAELSLIGATAVEREQAIALRYADADATDAQRAKIAQLAEEIVNAREAQAIIDDIKGTVSGFAVEAAMNFGHAGDAVEEFGERMKRMAYQLLADKAIQWLVNMFGASQYSAWGQANGIGAPV